MNAAGLDTSFFSAHPTRGAVILKAHSVGVVMADTPCSLYFLFIYVKVSLFQLFASFFSKYLMDKNSYQGTASPNNVL